MKSRSFDPLRIIIVLAVIGVIGVRVNYWIKGERVRMRIATGTSAIAGRVVDVDGQPVADAQVSAGSATFPPSMGGGRTNTEGRFSIGKLAAGSFVVDVTKKGFIWSTFGELAPGVGRTLVRVDDGQTRDGLTIVLRRGASVSGKVTNPDGSPAVGCTVHAEDTGPWRPPNNQYQAFLSHVPIGATGLNGQYELPAILPGTYYVWSSCARRLERTYAPETRDLDRATIVRLEFGDTRGDVNIRLMPPPAMSTVTGTVVGPENTPVVAQVMLGRRDGINQIQGRSDAEGRFTFSSVPADDYWVMAFVTSGPARLWAAQNVTSNGRRPSVVSLKLAPGATIRGQAKTTRLPGRPTESTTWFSLVAADWETRRFQSALGSDFNGSVNSEGRAVLSGIPPGRYSLWMGAEGWLTVDSATLDGQDWLDRPLAIAGAGEMRAEVTLVEPAASINGRVISTGSTRKPDDSWVVIFPADPALRQGDHRVQVIRPLSDGTYTIAVPRGSYLLATTGVVTPEEWPTSALFERLAIGAVKVTLNTSEMKTLDLPAPPAPGIR